MSLGLSTLMDAPLTGPYMGMGMMPNMGMGMMMPGVVMPTYNPQAQMSNIQQWDNFGVSRQVQMFQNQNNAQFRMASQNSDIQRQIQILHSQIKANNQNNIKTEYRKLLRSVEAQYSSQLQGMDDEQKQAKLKEDMERFQIFLC